MYFNSYPDEYSNQIPAVVIDNGSSECKVGFSGEDYPKPIFSSIFGRPKAPGIMIGLDPKNYYIGEDALCKRGVLKLTYPIENGIFINWDDMERI